ncbi:MAG: hypothetical protein IT353_04180 [Gemmatimonadaceae bacterium]|nr:hypothetical protein [Gemmatimonadaceae bacterium]
MRTRRVSSRAARTGRRVAVVAFAWAASGCVYFNGIYNAKSAARNGDARLRRGAETEASAFFQTSAAKAETVLVRHPTSTWRPRALYLAGRGAALGGLCDQAVPRLHEFLRLQGNEVDDVARARVALASCELRQQQIAPARARLDSLIDWKEPHVARQARVWAARAALAAGDRDGVVRYLNEADDATLPWELVLASLSAREYTRVESLLVQRAVRADYRDDAIRAIRELWAAGHARSAETIVAQYDAGRVRDASRAQMHFVVGDLSLRDGDEPSARRHLVAARTLAGRDTVTSHEADARLAFLALMRTTTLRDVDTVFARLDSAVQRTPYARRVAEHVLLLRLLALQTEVTGASMFLAGEIARDSLRARALAQGLFLRVTREFPGSPLVPQAWYAASLLTPDSADSWRARIVGEHSASFVAAWLRGEDPSTRPDFTLNPALLSARWNETLRTWSDSVRKLRAAPRPSASARPMPDVHP